MTNQIAGNFKFEDTTPDLRKISVEVLWYKIVILGVKKTRY